MSGDARTSTRQTAAEDGLVLHHQVTGDGAGDVLLAHGLTSTGALEWRHLLPLLRPRYRCLVPDLRGHGHSEHSATRYGWDVVGDDLRALLQGERAQRPHLVGFSFGSEVLLRMAVREPALPASLTLIGTSLGRPAQMPVQELPPAGSLAWPAALRRAHAALHGPDHWEVLVRLMSRLWQEVPELTDDELGRLRCPVLVVVGEHELAFKREQARRLVALVPGARLLEVPGAGHEVHVAEHRAVGAQVVAHLAAADAAPALSAAPRN